MYNEEAGQKERVLCQKNQLLQQVLAPISPKGKYRKTSDFSLKRKMGELNFTYVVPCMQWQMMGKKNFQKDDVPGDFLHWP